MLGVARTRRRERSPWPELLVRRSQKKNRRVPFGRRPAVSKDLRQSVLSYRRSSLSRPGPPVRINVRCQIPTGHWQPRTWEARSTTRFNIGNGVLCSYLSGRIDRRNDRRYVQQVTLASSLSRVHRREVICGKSRERSLDPRGISRAIHGAKLAPHHLG